MLKQAVRLNLVQGRLKKAFLVKLVVIIFAATKRSEFRSLKQMSAQNVVNKVDIPSTNLLVQEFNICGTLVGNIPIKCSCDLILCPLNLTIPVVALIFFIAFILKGEIGFLGRIFAV